MMNFNSTLHTIYDRDTIRAARRMRRASNRSHALPKVRHGWKGSHVRFSLNTDEFKRAIVYATRAVIKAAAIVDAS